MTLVSTLSTDSVATDAETVTLTATGSQEYTTIYGSAPTDVALYMKSGSKSKHVSKDALEKDSNDHNAITMNGIVSTASLRRPELSSSYSGTSTGTIQAAETTDRSKGIQYGDDRQYGSVHSEQPHMADTSFYPAYAVPPRGAYPYVPYYGNQYGVQFNFIDKQHYAPLYSPPINAMLAPQSAQGVKFIPSDSPRFEVEPDSMPRHSENIFIPKPERRPHLNPYVVYNTHHRLNIFEPHDRIAFR